MFLPAIAVLILTLAMNEPARHLTTPFPWRYLPIALFLIPVVLHAVMLPTMMALQGTIAWQDWLTPQADGLYRTPESRGWGTLTLTGLAGRIALNAVVGLVVVTFLAYFEEIGWRAWLLPRLEDRMGPRRAVVVTAVIWGFWHVPFQLSGIQHVEGVAPVRLAMGAPFGIMATGLVIGWLWLRTGKRVDCLHRARRAEQLGTVRLQVHEGSGGTSHRGRDRQRSPGSGRRISGVARRRNDPAGHHEDASSIGQRIVHRREVR
jgi:membrane protease YdiL (CAAX protease family)